MGIYQQRYPALKPFHKAIRFQEGIQMAGKEATARIKTRNYSRILGSKNGPGDPEERGLKNKGKNCFVKCVCVTSRRLPDFMNKCFFIISLSL